MSKFATIKKPAIDLDAAMAFAEGIPARDSRGVAPADLAGANQTARSQAEEPRMTIDLDAALAFAEAKTSQPANATVTTGVEVSSAEKQPAASAPLDPAPMGYRRLTILLDQWLHKQVKLSAMEQGTTVDEVIARLLRKHLEKNGYSLSFHGSRVRNEDF